MKPRGNDIRFTVGNKSETRTTVPLKELDGGPEATLERLFALISQKHPELAPILENATKADDLEIRINNAPIAAEETERVRLRGGESVSLFVKEG